MRNTASAILAIAALALAGQPVWAQGTSVGVNAVDVPAGSDTYVSVPFTDELAEELTVDSVSGATQLNLTTGGLTADEFADFYYVRFTSGALKGRWFTITANGGNTLTVDGDVSAANNGDELAVFKHWTISELFPDGLTGVSFRSAANPFQRPFEILIPNNSGAGINKPATVTLFHINGTWAQVGGGNADNRIVDPQGVLILRNNAAASTGEPDDPQTLADESSGDLVFFPAGLIDGVARSEPVEVAATANDTILGGGNVFPKRIADFDLETSGVFTASPNPFQRTDELLVFDGSVQGINKPASVTYFRVGSDWFKVGSGTPANDDLLDSGAVLLIRKASGTPSTLFWTQSAN